MSETNQPNDITLEIIPVKNGFMVRRPDCQRFSETVQEYWVFQTFEGLSKFLESAYSFRAKDIPSD